MHASERKLSKELKNGIEILVGHVVLKLWIKTVKTMFRSLKNRLAYLNLNAIFWVSWTIYYKMHVSFFKKVLII